MPIQWYPGHMAKARRQLIESLKLIDVVVELVDARAPKASRNPDFDDLFAAKTRVVLLNKSDLADAGSTQRWVDSYRKQGIYAAALSSAGASAKKVALPLFTRAAQPCVEARKAKGVNKVVRILVAGVPNVGKSTFINRIAGQNRTQTGDRPGVTKGKQWVKVTPHLELLDSPGLLWPKLEDNRLATHLAFLGSINDEILSIEELAQALLVTLRTLAPEQLSARYAKITADTADVELLEAVARSRGFILRGGVYDTERAARIVLDEFRGGKIARVTLETPSEADHGKTE